MRMTAHVLLLIVASILLSSSAWGATFTVQVRDFVFVPPALTINIGDTVHWVDAMGTHTVTNGLSPLDPNHGSLFDRQLSPGQTFDYTFTDMGVVPYYCNFHWTLGMLGTITVIGVTAVEPATWGRIKGLYAR
jgi:plastocyanin